MKNVLILTYWSYPEALIETYTLPYVRIILKNLPRGSSVFLLTLEKDVAFISGNNRVEIESQLKKQGIQWLPFAYKPFGISAFFMWMGIFAKLCALIIQKKMTTIHCWCTPPGGIGYFLSILLNKKLILDSYEPHAEAMVENGTWKKDGLAFKLLFWLERKQTERASYIISATEGMREYAKRKYRVNIKNFLVKPACVDLQLFSEKDLKDPILIKKYDFENKIVCVYAGKFGGIYLEREVFDFFKVAADYWGSSFRVMILASHTREQIVDYCQQAGLASEIVHSLLVSHQQVPRYLGLGDFAISPIKPIPTKRYCTPIKDGEYWAMGLPVVIPSNISDDSAIIEKNKIGSVLNRFDKEAYRNAVVEIEQLLKMPKEERFKKIRSMAVQYRNFEIAENVYREVYGH